MAAGKLNAALAALRACDVDFIVVGGLAAVLNGAPMYTYDVDVLYALDDANVDGLMKFRDDARFGPVNFLGSIGNKLRYEDMLPHSDLLDLGDGVEARVLHLDTLIRLKEELATENDKAMLPLLRETLRQRHQRS